MNSIFSKKNKNEKNTIDTIESLSHTKWNCKYHIVFAGQKYEKIAQRKSVWYNINWI